MPCVVRMSSSSTSVQCLSGSLNGSGWRFKPSVATAISLMVVGGEMVAVFDMAFSGSDFFFFSSFAHFSSACSFFVASRAFFTADT